jgi:integrase
MLHPHFSILQYTECGTPTKMLGLDYTQFSLMGNKGLRKLLIVLHGSELKALLKSCELLKHKLIIGFCYGCGIRSSEVRHLK